ncbi:nuclear distribution protein NudE [Histoplasma ohiense]|nr:nuclear distribution protein NudE [Histoplasma ohiense (nom. inval.)]
MPLPDEPPSSPPSASTSTQDIISYYKKQYEHLEAELADFQSSSRELEAELEKDIEASERRERKLNEKLESSAYEIEEWKAKYKQAKTEANSAQSALQKEITSLRDGNRTLQLKLRDIEVANDDFERQARNTSSSLEDLESKYNVSIERGVLLEEEIKHGEQERETLRIENQRLRDELSDLKIEAHIIQEKLRKAELLLKQKNNLTLTPGLPVSHTPDISEHSPATTSSSPTIATPPTKSVSSVASDTQTPPSPPFSESSYRLAKATTTPSIPRPRVSISESGSRPPYPSSKTRHSRGPSIPTSNGNSTPSVTSRRSITRSYPTQQPPGLPRSGSLYQIRGLIGKMQKLEERVQSARSRLPAPVETPPKVSPRTNSALGQNYIPSSVTIRRSSRKRTSGSVASSRDGESTSSYGRSSFGLNQGTPTRAPQSESRPSSRASVSSRSSISQLPVASSSIPQPRSESRQSITGSRTPLGHYSTNPTTESRRPRSSLSNYSHSVNMGYIDENEDITTPTPRRSTFNKGDHVSGIPTPGGLKKRESGGSTNNPPSMLPTPRRISSGVDRRDGDMGPPERKHKLSEVGESY